MRTKSDSRHFKVATDLFWEQLSWAAWYIPIILIVHLLMVYFISDIGEYEHSFMAFMYPSSNIYMLVIGIIAHSFFGFFVKNGVTRREYVLGAGIAASTLALVLMIIAAIITEILHSIQFPPGAASIAHITIMEISPHWMLSILAISLILLCYYMAGWLIAIGFYRYGNLRGLIFICIAVVLVFSMETLWAGGHWGGNPVGFLGSWAKTSNSNISFAVASTFTLLLTAIGWWFVRLVSLRAPIKL